MSILDESADAGHALLDPISAVINPHFGQPAITPALRADDFPGGFKILEYISGEAQYGFNPAYSPIRLTGNMMPMQPYPWDQEARLIKERYPGNNEAAVQHLGTSYGDLVIRGRFKDKKYKTESGLYGVSYQIVQSLEAMQERGNVLQFGLEGSAGSWIRYGYLEKVSFKMNKISWIDYELTFFVVGRSLPRNAYFAAKENQLPSTVNQQLIDLANASFSPAPTKMPQTLAEKMNGLINGVAKNIALVTGFVQNVLTAAQDVQASAQRALGLVKNLQTSLASFRRQIGAITNSTSVYSQSGNPASRATDTYSNLAYVHEMSAQTHAISAQVAKLKANLQTLAFTVPLARYLVRKGDTLQGISVKFYGVSDNWAAIQTHNNLQSTILVEATVLEIPKV